MPHRVARVACASLLESNDKCVIPNGVSRFLLFAFCFLLFAFCFLLFAAVGRALDAERDLLSRALLYAIGGVRNPPVAASIFAATASTASSSQGLPTICTPTGKPSAERPTGTTAAGFPSKLNHCE
jgi:Na+/proline symporter